MSECQAWVKGTRTKECPKCHQQFNGKKKAAPAPKTPAPKPEPVQVEVEKPIKVADAITITQVKAVAELVALVGGFDRCHQLLAVVREVGGLKRMKDLIGSSGRCSSRPKQSVNQPPVRLFPSEPWRQCCGSVCLVAALGRNRRAGPW